MAGNKYSPAWEPMRRSHLTLVIDNLKAYPGIGLIPPEFDAIAEGELELKEDLGNHEAGVSE